MCLKVNELNIGRRRTALISAVAQCDGYVVRPFGNTNISQNSIKTPIGMKYDI